LIRIVLGFAAVVLVAGVLAYAFRDPLATKLADVALDRSSKLHCTEPRIHLGSALDRIEVGAIECTMREGPLRYARTRGLTAIELDMFEPTLVTVDKVEIDMRDRDASKVRTDTEGDLVEITGLADMLFKGMLDFSELYSPSAPPVTVRELTMSRAGKREAVLKDFRKTSDGEWDRCQAPSVSAPGIAQLVSVRGLDLRVMPSKGRLNADVYLTKPGPNSKPDITVTVEGRRLDQPRPQFEVEL
jgi:hypothetical protein